MTALGPGIVYSRLLRLRTGPEDLIAQPSLLLECELCESWEMVDPLTYRFTLREGVLWQDIDPVNGRELVAEDLAFSYERQRTPGWPNAPLLQNIETIEAEDQYTLKVTLDPEFPDADFMLALADGHTKVVPHEVVEANGDLMEGPVIGSEPWIWVTTEDDFGSSFVKNSNYFEGALPFPDEFITRVIKGEEETRLAAFAVGIVDVYRVPPDLQDVLDESGAEFDTFMSFQGGTGLVLTMNTSRAPFDNLQVRKAVLRALDPWDYVRTIWSDQGYVSLGIPVMTPDWLLSRDEIRGTYFADPEAAEDLLATVDPLVSLKFDLDVAFYGDFYIEQGIKIEEDLRSVGFEPTFNEINPSQYQDIVWLDKDYQIAVGQLPPSTTTNGFLFPTLHSASPLGNVVDHSNDLLDAMIVEQAVVTDPDTRKELVRGIQELLLDEAYLFSPVTGAVRWAVNPRVNGFYPNPAGSEYFYWAKTWLE